MSTDRNRLTKFWDFATTDLTPALDDTQAVYESFEHSWQRFSNFDENGIAQPFIAPAFDSKNDWIY
jgi:hypothetical protein